MQIRTGDCGQLIPSCVSCSFFLTLLPCSALGSVLVGSPLRTALAWLLSSGCSLSGAGCCSMGPHGVTDPARRAPAGAALHGACQKPVPVPAGPFCGQQIPSRHSHLLQQGVLHALHCGSDYLWALWASLGGSGLGNWGSVLELAVCVMGTTPGFWQKPTLQLLADKTWLCKPNKPLNVSEDIGKQHYLYFQPFWLNQIFKLEILSLRSGRNC